MKKTIALLIVILFILCGCTSNINKYKINEDDKYFTKDNASGGNKIADIAIIDKIWTTRWLGSEKLVFDFKKEDQSTSQIPYYTIAFSSDKTSFRLTLFHCIEGDFEMLQASKCRYITQIIRSTGDDSLIYDIITLPDLKYAIDEITPSGQLVINIKKIED